MRRQRRCAAWLALVLVGVLGATGCTNDSTVLVAQAGEADRMPGGSRVLDLDFDDLATHGTLEAGEAPLRNGGRRPVTVRVATIADGVVRAAPGAEGGMAARFPEYDAASPQGAIIVVTGPDEGTGLSPGPRDFRFGVDFVLDELSEEGGEDNGNNLVQRGLFSDGAQYKLQVEKGRVSCRVAGTAGEVIVKSETLVEPHEWYRVTCSRLGDVVVLELGPVDGESRRVVASGATGSVQLPKATPIVIGGKATGSGKPVAGNSDQFNGVLDNVFLELGALV